MIYPEGKEYMRCALGAYEIYFPAETPRIESKNGYFVKLYFCWRTKSGKGINFESQKWSGSEWLED